MDTFAKLIRLMALVAALGVAITLTVQAPDVPDAAVAAARIESSHTLDNLRAEGAPQQQVVNGWTTHEYLGLVAELSGSTARSVQQLQFLMALLVALTAVEAMTRRRKIGAVDTADSGSPSSAPENEPVIELAGAGRSQDE